MSEWYYGQDDAQRGPVDEDVLSGMLERGQLHADTLVWRSGMDDWITVGEVPAFRQALAAAASRAAAAAAAARDASNPYAAPTSSPVEQALARPVGGQPLDAVECVSRGWALFQEHALLLFGLCLFNIVVSSVMGGIEGALQQQSPYGSGIVTPTLPSTVVGLLGSVIDLFLTLGLTVAMLKVVDRGPGPPLFSDLFTGGPKLLKYIGASILFGIMVVVGLLLLIVPGIYLATRFGFYTQAMVDRDLGPIESLQYSWQITDPHQGQVFLTFLLSFLIVLLGLMVLCLGVLVAIPIATVVVTVAYRWLDSGSDMAPPMREHGYGEPQFGSEFQ